MRITTAEYRQFARCKLIVERDELNLQIATLDGSLDGVDALSAQLDQARAALDAKFTEIASKHNFPSDRQKFAFAGDCTVIALETGQPWVPS